jgi:hypothetical protein
MATDFTVLLPRRRHVGNNPEIFDKVDPGLPFAGPVASVSFDCPGIDPTETALLMFQSRHVDHPRNILRINSVDVPGGLPISAVRDGWNANVVLVEPQHQLKSAGNVLHLESRTSSGESSGDIDDFVLDNVVLVYKTPVLSLPWVAADLEAFLENELLRSIENVKGSGKDADPNNRRNEYVLPTESQLAAWRVVFRSLLTGAFARAHLEAKRISSTYNVVQFLDTRSGRTHYVLMEGVPGRIPAPRPHDSGVNITDPRDPARRGWGTYLFDAQPQRAVSVSAPHVHDDLDTAEQAIEAYLTLGARTLLIAGADRDQNMARAPCAQSVRPYFESDVSHTAESVFQMAFEEIYSSDAVTWHLQFHGNSTCNEDVFLSNGVAAAPAILSSLAANIVAASTAAAAGGPVLSTDVFDATGGCAARGRDNMQMRFASGLPHASICAEPNVPVGPSRFIHIEQRRDARRAPTDLAATPGRNRAVVIAGILATFPGWKDIS